jgi:hypothetical protein
LKRDLQTLLKPIPLQIIALVNAEVIHLLYQTHKALIGAARLVHAEERSHPPSNGRVGRSDKARTPTASSFEAKSKEVKAEREKSLSRAALKVLTKCSSQVEGDQAIPKAESQQIFSEKPVPSTEHPKLTKFLICVSEDTGFPRSLRFQPGVFDGAALFQHDEDDQGGEKAALHGLEDENTLFIGGTIYLKGPEREFNRIEKILTLLVRRS